MYAIKRGSLNFLLILCVFLMGSFYHGNPSWYVLQIVIQNIQQINGIYDQNIYDESRDFKSIQMHITSQ